LKSCQINKSGKRSPIKDPPGATDCQQNCLALDMGFFKSVVDKRCFFASHSRLIPDTDSSFVGCRWCESPAFGHLVFTIAALFARTWLWLLCFVKALVWPSSTLVAHVFCAVFGTIYNYTYGLRNKLSPPWTVCASVGSTNHMKKLSCNYLKNIRTISTFSSKGPNSRTSKFSKACSFLILHMWMKVR
jgi:hypothetical protein